MQKEEDPGVIRGQLVSNPNPNPDPNPNPNPNPDPDH